MALMKVRDKDGNIKPILAIKGEQGDSAYQIAQADGFDGTEEEWLESLIGRKGSKPVKGEDYLTEADKEEITNDTVDSVIEAATNMVIHNSEQDRAYIDDEMAKLREYIDIYHPVVDLTINVTMADGSAVPDGVYVTVYDLSSDSVYAYEQFTGTPIVLKDIPVGFDYSASISEIDGYFASSIVNGTLTEDAELLFTYTGPSIYGVSWGKTSSTILSRTDAAALFEDPVPYVAGATEYGSPFDNLYPWSDMKIVEDPTAGTLVTIPKYWFRWTDTDSMLKLEVANYAAEGFSVSPAHRDRGDGKGERDVVYIGRYHCSIDDYKSTTGVKPKVSATRATFRTNIHNLGSNIYQNDFAMFWTIRMLYLVEYADWDSQKVIGRGCGNGSSTEVMGYTDSMPYHTGTTKSSRTTYGFGTQYRYIEGLWDNVRDWCDGVYFSSANVYGIFNPNNFSDTANGTLVGTRPTSNGYIKSWGISSVEGFDWFLYPATFGGSTTTYVPDVCGYNSSGVVLYVGSYYQRNLDHGLFCLGGGSGASGAGGVIGSRLMVLP